MSARPTRARLRATMFGALVAGALMAVPSAASAASLGLSVTPSARTNESFTVKAAGTADQPSHVYLYIKPDDGTPCAPNQRAASDAYHWTLASNDGRQPQIAAGDYSRDLPASYSQPGPQLLCGYLAANYSAEPDARGEARMTIVGDSDGDRVYDDADKCPKEAGRDDTAGGQPTADGCPRYDFDGDGTADTCPTDRSAAFTIVGVRQPEPGRAARLRVEVPGAGELTVTPDDGGQPYAERVKAAGPAAITLPTSEATARKYSGGTQNEAGKAVTVRYAVKFAQTIPFQCKGESGMAPDPTTTQPLTYTFKPYPLMKVRFSFSTKAPGRYVAELTCTNIAKAVCDRHRIDVDLSIDEKAYHRLLAKGHDLPDDNLIDDYVTAKNGEVGFKLDAKTTRALKRIGAVEAKLAVRLNGVKGKGRALRVPYPLEKNVTIRNGKIATTVVVADNADQGPEL